MKVVGIENKKGTFNKNGEQIAYDVNYIHCTETAPNVNGVRCKSFKIGKNVEFVGFTDLSELLKNEVLVATGYSEQYGSYVKSVALIKT